MILQIEKLQSSDINIQLSAIKQIKNSIIGHFDKKKLYVELKIVPCIVHHIFQQLNYQQSEDNNHNKELQVELILQSVKLKN